MSAEVGAIVLAMEWLDMVKPLAGNGATEDGCNGAVTGTTYRYWAGTDTTEGASGPAGDANAIVPDAPVYGKPCPAG